MTTGRTKIAVRLAAGGLLAVAGCQADRGPITISSDDPDRKILAIRRDAEHRNPADDAALVTCLSDDDAAIRIYSIRTLQTIAGTDFGYHYYESAEQRAPAVSKWRQWLGTKK